MPTLILEHNGSRRAGTLMGRVVIGRRANSHIVIPDRYVSRIHAWIGQADGRYFIADTGSRSGTRVNGQLIAKRHDLADGDTIRIGPATLTFHANGALPPDAREMDLSDRPTESDDGIFMDCACGAPLWAPWDFAGRVGQCRYCGQMLELPKPKQSRGTADPSSDTMAPAMAAPRAPSTIRTAQAPSPPRPPRKPRPSLFDAPGAGAAQPKPAAKVQQRAACGACQSAISLLEETTRCPECGVAFHANCWIENRGCSSYGCKQVGILGGPTDAAHARPAEMMDPAEAPAPAAGAESVADAPIQWEYLFLPLALIGSVLGLLAFGVPALLAAAAVLVLRLRGRTLRHPRLVNGALALCLTAAVAGFALSWYWWLSAPVFARVSP